MRLGIYLDLRNPPAWRRPWDQVYGRALDRIAAAERLGLESVWLGEHHMFEDGYLPQPLTFAAAVAARTSTMRIGTSVVLAPLRPALQIAEDAALVDLISAGRLELGLGSGYLPEEFRRFGADHDRRLITLRERVDEVRELWTSGICLPPPVQDPVPIWYGVMRPAGARVAGRLGVGLLRLDATLLEPYRRGLREGGHDPATARMSGVANIVLADDPLAVVEVVREHHAYQQASYRRAVTAQSTDSGARPASLVDSPTVLVDGQRAPGDTALPPQLHVLTPDQAANLLLGWLDGLPVEHVFLWDSIAGMPDELVNRHVHLAATQLAPALRESRSEARPARVR